MRDRRGRWACGLLPALVAGAGLCLGAGPLYTAPAEQNAPQATLSRDAASSSTGRIHLAQVRGRPPGGGGGGGGSGVPLGGILGAIITSVPPPPPNQPPPSKPPKTTPPQGKFKAPPTASAPSPRGAAILGDRLTTNPEQEAGEVLTLVGADQPPEVEDELAARFGLERIELQQVILLDGRVTRFRILVNVDVATMVTRLSGDPRVVIAQPNFLYNDAQQPQPAASKGAQYGLEKLAVAPAHQIAQGRDVVVAVIDTGVDTAHPAIKDVISGTFNAVSDKLYVAHAHGTSIAGVIAGRGKLGGVAPGAKLLAVRAMYLNKERQRPETSSYILLKAIDWAFNHMARIINMSLAGPQDPLVHTILNVSEAKGAVHVAAAGNGGPKAPPAYPAAYDSVVAVTATDVRDQLYAIANRGDYLELAAPGVDILAPTSAGKYGYTSGTSIAAAHVSGLVALMREVDANTSAGEVRRMLMEGAVDLGPKGRDSLYGAGRPDALAILGKARGITPQ